MTAMDQQEARGRLEAERNRLETLREENADLDPSLHPEENDISESTQAQHQADIGTETATKEADLSMLESIDAELSDIEHALRRIDAGTYGTCEACGKVIADERLEALPAARFCLDDQHLAEREAGRSQVE
jgi:RNA polymerase-binding transcription factor DksA